jgi:uracil-DNA glycosylase family 4
MKEKELEKIKKEVLKLQGGLADLRRTEKYHPVMGEGSLTPKIMFIGEAPGENEAKTGRPFVGRAGKLLDELLAEVNISREEVFITSIVKDRPPKNRDPLPDEIDAYAPFLDKQMEVLKPNVIATLGRFSMTYIMSRYGLGNQLGPISSIHGKVLTTKMPWREEIKIVPLFHPAAAIYNQSLKPALVEDFKVLKTLI